MLKLIFVIFLFSINLYSQNWIQVGLNEKSIYSFDVSSQNSITIIASYIDSNKYFLARSFDAGSTWNTDRNLLGKIFHVAIDRHDNAIVFASGELFLPSNSEYVFFAKSTNGGKSWLTVDSGLVWDPETTMSKFYISSIDSKKIVAGTHGFFGGGLYLSSNSGENWIEAGEQYRFVDGISQLAISPHDSNRIVVPTDTLFFSDDFGLSWDIIPKPSNFNAAYDIAFGNSSNQLFIAGRKDNQLFKTDDFGQTWENIGVSLNESLKIMRVYFYPISNNDYLLYVIAFRKLFMVDSKNNWCDIGTDTVLYNDIRIADNVLYVSTNKGIFKKEISTSSSEINDFNNIEFKLCTNYPNPFNPRTTISYSIPKRGFVQLKVFDILGKEVAQLVNEDKQIGNYKVTFDASNLTSGVYFYRLQSGNFSDVKKLVLLR